jgi:hypothetical protein
MTGAVLGTTFAIISGQGAAFGATGGADWSLNGTAGYPRPLQQHLYPS